MCQAQQREVRVWTSFAHLGRTLATALCFTAMSTKIKQGTVIQQDLMRFCYDLCPPSNMRLYARSLKISRKRFLLHTEHAASGDSSCSNTGASLTLSQLDRHEADEGSSHLQSPAPISQAPVAPKTFTYWIKELHVACPWQDCNINIWPHVISLLGLLAAKARSSFIANDSWPNKYCR